MTDWSIELIIAGFPEPLRLTVNSELFIGRIAPNQTDFVGLDLSGYKGGELGVSRRHARLAWSGSNLTITDLGSDNGTLLNGKRLQANVPYRLSDKDEVYLGHLQVTVRLNTETGQSSIRAKKGELDLANAPAKGRSQRVLVVEDDPQITRMYQLIIEHAGYTVQVCRDVVSAIRVLNQQAAPALIILDMKLPGVQGVELCRYVRRDTEYPSIPIVVASALSDQDSVQNAMQAGADVFIAKPFNPQELSRVVAAVIFAHERDNPTLGTKKLAGTASLDFIAAANRNDTVIFFVEGQREPVGTVVETAVTMGRGNPPGGLTRGYVDLGAYGAFDKGVSRVHARVKRDGKAFAIEDLGSANGTFINGYSLNKNEVYPLKNGDQIRLGELKMHVYMLAETERETT